MNYEAIVYWKTDITHANELQHDPIGNLCISVLQAQTVPSTQKLSYWFVPSTNVLQQFWPRQSVQALIEVCCRLRSARCIEQLLKCDLYNVSRYVGFVDVVL